MSTAAVHLLDYEFHRARCVASRRLAGRFANEGRNDLSHAHAAFGAIFELCADFALKIAHRKLQEEGR